MPGALQLEICLETVVSVRQERRRATIATSAALVFASCVPARSVRRLRRLCRYAEAVCGNAISQHKANKQPFFASWH